MPTISNAQSSNAPGVAEWNGNIVAVWPSATAMGSFPAQVLFMAVCPVMVMQFGGMTNLGGGSAGSPGVAWWNGVFYVVFRGAEKVSGTGSDTNLYFILTDLASSTPGSVLAATSQSSYGPTLVPLPETLVLAYSDANNPGAISYLKGSASWLVNSSASSTPLPNMFWGDPVTIPGTTNVTAPPGLAIVETEEGQVWVAAWKDGPNIQYLTCVGEAWSSATPGTIAASANSAPVLTTYDNVVYAFWSDATMGAVYVVYDANAGTWSSATQVPNGPGVQAKLSVTAGSEGIFLGFNDPAQPQPIGVLRVAL